MIGVLVVGDVINDLIVRPDEPGAADSDTTADVTAAPGGSAANLAAWLAAAGVPVRLAARVGAGDADTHRGLLAGAGVDARLAVDMHVRTGSIVVVVGADGSRTMFTDRGANTRLGARDLPLALLDDIGHMHVSGYALLQPASRAAVEALWAAAERSGLTRSVDVASAGFLRDTGSDFLDWSRGSDVVFANVVEGRVVTGTDVGDGPDMVVDRLLQHYPVVVLKQGAEGAIVATATERLAAPPAPPASLPTAGTRRSSPAAATPKRRAAPAGEIVDPTGAGDAFDAGFLAAWLDRADLSACAAAGAKAAALAVQLLGGRPPTATDLAAPPDVAWDELRAAAHAVSAHAFAPYSGLAVGAAGLSDEGRIVTACNVENASFGLALCAECGLVSALRAGGGQRLVAISVVAGDGQPLTPCGRCRQVLLDNGGPTLLIDRGPSSLPVALEQLLPGAFDAEELYRRSPL